MGEAKDLKSMTWDTAKGEVRFHPDLMEPTYYTPVFRSTFSSGGAGDVCARVCIRCENVFPLEPCGNCGEEGFVPGISTAGVAGVFCFKCQKGFSSWTCQDCGTENPINKSLGIEKGGCFIATAVYGSDLASEVILLKKVRDEHLLKSKFGHFMVNLYYGVSPSIARVLKLNPFLRRLIKVLFIKPLVIILKKTSKKEKNSV
jgi:hypothetical protein